jgi:arabinan endo-1,5-alpha-L-arabinosidase
VGGGVLRWDTQAADLFEGNNSASVLTRDLPDGNWMIETRMKLNLPAEGCCFNYVQAGLVVYGDDDAYLKLVHVSIWETRQTEWAKEVPTPIANGARYGNTVVAAPNEWTWFRIASWTRGGERHYQAYTSRDGQTWTRGGVWTHELADPSLGLVSMGGSGFTAEFDYVRVSRLQATGSQPLR